MGGRGNYQYILVGWVSLRPSWPNSLDWPIWADILVNWRHNDTVIANLILAQWFISYSKYLQAFRGSLVYPKYFPYHTLMWLSSKITCRCGVIMSSTPLSSSHVIFGWCLPCQFYQRPLAHLNFSCITWWQTYSRKSGIIVSRILFKLNP